MKTDRIYAFRNSVGKLVEMLTDKSVTVTQRGSDAYVQADPKTGIPNLVNIPHVPDNASEELLEAINGFLDHEVAHILFTDWTMVKRATAKGQSVASMFNILEDCRIEKLMGEKFRGSAYNLGTMGAFFVKRMTMPMLNKAVASGDKNAIASVLIPPLMRSIYGQRVFKEFMTPDMMDLVGPFYSKIKGMEAEIEGIVTCEDALRVAEAIDAKVRVSGGRGSGRDLREGTAGAKKDPKSGSGKESSSSKKGKKKPEEKRKKEEKKSVEDEIAESIEAEESKELTEERSSTKGEADDERAEEIEGDDDTELVEEEESAGTKEPEDEDFDEPTRGAKGEHDPDRDFEEEREGSGPGSHDEDFGDDDMSASDFDEAMSGVSDFDGAMAKSISGEAAAASEKAKYHVYTTDFDLIEPLPRSSRYDNSMLVKLEDKVNHLVAPMQKELERIIAARSLAQWSNGHRSGRLHGASLTRIITGDDRVFRRRHEVETKDTAVSLVLDISGSMACGRIQVAAQAAYALSQVLERIGIPHEVICFTTTNKTIPGSGRAGLPREAMERSRYSRWEPLWMPILKGYDERLNSETKARFADVPNHPLANNVDGECVGIAARRLLGRPQKGKTMIVLSDGYPACDGPTGDQNAELQRTVRDVEASNVRCVGIGIQSDAVKKFYARHVILNRVEDLPTTVMRELRSALAA